MREIFFWPALYFTVQFLIHAVPELMKWENSVRTIAINEEKADFNAIADKSDSMLDKYKRLEQGQHNLLIEFQKIKERIEVFEKENYPIKWSMPEREAGMHEVSDQWRKALEAAEYIDELKPEMDAAIDALYAKIKATNRRTQLAGAWKSFWYLSWQFILPLCLSCFCLWVSNPFH